MPDTVPPEPSDVGIPNNESRAWALAELNNPQKSKQIKFLFAYPIMFLGMASEMEALPKSEMV